MIFRTRLRVEPVIATQLPFCQRKPALMKYVVWGLIAVLVVIHQDIWNWDNDKLVLGFLPITLAYHAGISIAASIVWLIAATMAWPVNSEDDDNGTASGNTAIADPTQEASR